MDCIDCKLDLNLEKYEIDIDCIRSQLQQDICLLNCINSEMEIKKPIEQFLINHADSVSSVDTVAKSKRHSSYLGRTMPDSIDKGDLNREPILHEEHKLQNVNSSGTMNGPKSPEDKIYFVTLNFPRDQKIRLNKKENKEWRRYKSKEQMCIMNRIINVLDRPIWYISYEQCSDGVIHLHGLFVSSENKRDFMITIQRFYNIHTKAFADVQELKSFKDSITSGQELYDNIPEYPNLQKYFVKGFIAQNISK